MSATVSRSSAYFPDPCRGMSSLRFQATHANTVSLVRREPLVCASVRGYEYHLLSGMQDARERGGDVSRLQRLHEQLADAGGECPLCQGRAAMATHQYDRQLAP